MPPVESHTVSTSADISTCGNYRYSLSRIWDTSKPVGALILLNPSTATALLSDQTVCNCNNLAVQWGWGGFHIVNLFAFRATNPQQLKSQIDPIGPLTDQKISQIANLVSYVVLAWGNGHRSRAEEVRKLLGARKFYCIKKNSGGGYLHPARIKVEDYPRPIPI